MCDVPFSSGAEFVVGGPTSDEEDVGTSTGAPIEVLSSF